MIWTHVSTEVEYRSPLGALRTGETVRLSLTASLEMPVWEKGQAEATGYEIQLLLLSPDGVWQELEMRPAGVSQERKPDGIWQEAERKPDEAWQEQEGKPGGIWQETEQRKKEGGNKEEQPKAAGDQEERKKAEYAEETGHMPSFPPVQMAEEPEKRVLEWSCQWKASEQAGVYWYYFSISKGGEQFFYGSMVGRQSGRGVLSQEIPPCYQLTVYEKDFQTPEWFQNATMYQIFPDRYCRGRKENLERGIRYHQFHCRKVYAHPTWEEVPYYRAMPGEKDYYPSDFFGGDLEGIRQNLDTLHEMGVTCLYLNPIVEADSNHRYNTADYKKVDPILGTVGDFIRLCREAGRKGIRVLLDGVFSHTGSDSIYFNKDKNYPEPGAYQEEPSPYDSWYQFGDCRDSYQSWWGFETLPEVNELDPAWQDYMIKGEDSVFRYWLENGAYGFRLDVADELPDEVIEEMRVATKKQGADRVLLGEVWEDATTKESYGVKRTYALGKGLDSVMNYPFRDQTLAWLNGHSTTEGIASFLNAQRANYPEPMYLALMNLLSSHDVARLRTVLGAGSELKGMSRLDQAGYRLDYAAERRGASLSRLAMLLQFILPGVPSVYYGDEYGMCGLGDPFNRGPLEKRDPKMADYVKKISLLRRREKCLRSGRMSAKGCGDAVLAVLRLRPLSSYRHSPEPPDRQTDPTHFVDSMSPSCPPLESFECFLAVFNRADQPRKLTIRLDTFTEGLTAEERAWLKKRTQTPPEGIQAVAGTGEGLSFVDRDTITLSNQANTAADDTAATDCVADTGSGSGADTAWQLSLTLDAYEGMLLSIH